MLKRIVFCHSVQIPETVSSPGSSEGPAHNGELVEERSSSTVCKCKTPEGFFEQLIASISEQDQPYMEQATHFVAVRL